MRRIVRQGTRRCWTFLFLLILPSTLLAQSESWDAVFIGNSQAGSLRTRVEQVMDKDRPLVRVLLNISIQVRRGDDSSVSEVEYGTIETPTGEVLRLDTRTYASRQMIRVHGDVVDGKMVLKIASGDQKQEQIIPWGPDVRGPYGPEQSFARSPMKPGETRSIKTFVPDYNKIVLVNLVAKAVEPVELGGRVQRDLLRVEQTATALDGKPMPELTQTFWVDR